MRTPRPWSFPVTPTALSGLLAPGVTRTMIQTAVKSGRLLRLRPGVYLDARLLPDDPVDRHLLRAHAEQVARSEAVMSHVTAALVWRLPDARSARGGESAVTLTVPLTRGHRGPKGVVIHRADLPRHHIARDSEGYAVTSPARTAVDLARGMDLPRRLVLFDSAARHLVASFVPTPRRRDYASPQLCQTAQQALREAAGFCRATSLLPAVEACDPRRETPIESLTTGYLYLSQLPIPEFQVPIRSPLGMLYPDFLWRDAKLIGEADGAVKYTDQKVMLAEKMREQALRDLGFRIVRWLGREIYATPHLVMDRIARALGV